MRWKFDINSNSLSREYRFGFVLSWLLYTSFCFHLVFVPLFFQLGVNSLAYVNIASVLIYFGAIYFLRRKRIDAAFILGSFEVLTHAVLAVFILGWASGFHYHSLVVAVLVLIHPSSSRYLRIFIAGAIFVLYMSLFILSDVIDAAVPIDALTIDMLNIVNIAAFYFALTFLVYLYSKAAGLAEDELRVANANLDMLAKTDFLTGLLNRRYMLEILEQEVRRFKRTRAEFAIVMCDIDNFKLINDNYGHACGDRVLVEAVRIMLHTLREQDQIARWGGEEFLIFMPDTGLAAAEMAAERIRKNIQDCVIGYRDANLKITMTLGISVYDGGNDIDQSILIADHALYAGKLNGKNRVVPPGR
jgi:diguanylate cyclase (GGDEF)-like protein